MGSDVEMNSAEEMSDKGEGEEEREGEREGEGEGGVVVRARTEVVGRVGCDAGGRDAASSSAVGVGVAAMVSLP